jgi:glycosyltransferase involved in cell wall biosynthesis
LKNFISLIVCTHNPREDYLRRTLQSLRSQSMPKDQWELLLIDNASTEPLQGQWDLAWHPHSRHILETELGLTPARLRGIQEAKGEILVFVDDDNILPEGYLQSVFRISQDYPYLGAWGGGCEAEFESPVPEWIHPYLGNLAILKITRPCWTNQYFDYRCTPIGAGMCIRRNVGQRYLETLASRASTEHLDRKGSELVSCGDHDMAYCAIDLGLGVGLFPDLKPTHLIPNKRADKDYILKLLEADAFSSYMLRKARNFDVEHIPPQAQKESRFARFKRCTREFLSSIRGLIKVESDSVNEKTFEELVHEARIRGLRKAAGKFQ